MKIKKQALAKRERKHDEKINWNLLCAVFIKRTNVEAFQRGRKNAGAKKLSTFFSLPSSAHVN